MTERFSKVTIDINYSHRKLREPQQNLNTNKSTPGPVIFKLQKIEDKEKILKDTSGRKTPCL